MSTSEAFVPLAQYIDVASRLNSIEALKGFKALALENIIARHEHYKLLFMNILHQIEDYKLGEHDLKMQHFIETWREALQAIPAPKFEQKQTLQNILNDLKVNRDCLNVLSEDVKHAWQEFELEVSIEERCRKITDKDFKKFNAIIADYDKKYRPSLLQ